MGVIPEKSRSDFVRDPVNLGDVGMFAVLGIFYSLLIDQVPHKFCKAKFCGMTHLYSV